MTSAPRRRQTPSTAVRGRAWPPTIIQAMDHPAIWAGWFRDQRTWQPWRAFLASLFGLPLSYTDLELYRQCTGR